MKAKLVKESLNESFSIPLTIAAAFCLYKFIKGLIKQRRYAKMTSQEREDYKKRKRDYYEYKKLLHYINDFIKKDGKIKFEENYLYYIFKVKDVDIKIDKNNKTIFWNNLDPDLKHYGYKIGPHEEIEDMDVIKYTYINPIPISQEEIDGLVEAIKEENQEENQ